MVSRAVGVDIGTRTLTVAEVRQGRQGPTVESFGGLAIPAHAVREGEILDPEVVGRGIRELLSASKIGHKRAWLGVANQRVVVRLVALPWLPEAELRASLPFQVQEHIPIPVDEAELDVHLVEEFLSDDGERMQRALLVAAQRDMVAAHVEAAVAAGLKPVGVDLNAFAVLRAMGSSSRLEPGDDVLIDVGAGVTNLVVHRAGTPTFVRLLVIGGDDVTEALATELDIDLAEAEEAKYDTVPGTRDPVAQIVSDQIDAFVDEIRSTLEYHRTHAIDVRLAGITLTGGGSLLAGLADRLENAVRLPVRVGSPLEHTPANRTSLGPDDLSVVGPGLTTAIGLALGGLE